MKQTNFNKQINKDNRKYTIVKLKHYLLMKFSYGEKRKQRHYTYDFFHKDHYFDKENNSLPSPFYFKPTDIIIYDLIQKEDLGRTKKGLIKLFRKCYSHKFFSGSRQEEDIDKMIEGLDKTLHSGNSWYRIGLFDFSNNVELESYVNYFEIRFHNFCSSYAAVEIRIVLADKYIKELSNFIKEPYKKPGMRVHRYWGKNKKKSGAKISYGISSGVPSEHAKSQILYEQLQFVKSKFLREFVKFLPLIQYSKYKGVYGINVFETNITPFDKLDKSIYSGLGLNEMYGFYFSNAERLYIATDIISLEKYESDMMFVYNPNLINDYEMYLTPQNKVLEQLTRDYLENLYKVVILKDLGINYHNLISRFRNRINSCKTTRRHYKKLLKIKYQLNQTFYDFNKINEELPVNRTLEQAEEILEKEKYAKASIYLHFHPYSLFVGMPKRMWQQIRENYSEVENDLNRKIEISDSLAKYSSELITRRMVYIQVLLALITFILIIFPDKARDIADLIRNLWNFLPLR